MPAGHLADSVVDVAQQAAHGTENLEEVGIEVPGR
jgi:hypothetical protein